jgi:hypothetical protein
MCFINNTKENRDNEYDPQPLATTVNDLLPDSALAPIVQRIFIYSAATASTVPESLSFPADIPESLL